jgi:hypothetical protein
MVGLECSAEPLHDPHVGVADGRDRKLDSAIIPAGRRQQEPEKPGASEEGERTGDAEQAR